MENEIKYPLMILAGIIVIVLAHNNNMFGINLQTSDIQFYNKPIVLPFTLTNFTNPTIEAYFNEVQLYELLTYQENVSYINATNNQTYTILENKTRSQTVGYTKGVVSGVYTVTVSNVTSAGLIKIKVSEGNRSEVKSVDVRRAYVAIKNNFPNLVDKGKVWTVEVTTFNPQDDTLEAESVDIDIIDPLNTKETLTLDKSGNKFTKVFTFARSGNYQFKIHARKEGYDTKEVTVITAVSKEGGIHPIVYIWIFGAGLWMLLFLVKLAVRSKRR